MRTKHNFWPLAVCLAIMLFTPGALKAIAYVLLIAAALWFVCVAFVRPLIIMGKK